MLCSLDLLFGACKCCQNLVNFKSFNRLIFTSKDLRRGDNAQVHRKHTVHVEGQKKITKQVSI